MENMIKKMLEHAYFYGYECEEMAVFPRDARKWGYDRDEYREAMKTLRVLAAGIGCLNEVQDAWNAGYEDFKMGKVITIEKVRKEFFKDMMKEKNTENTYESIEREKIA